MYVFRLPSSISSIVSLGQTSARGVLYADSSKIVVFSEISYACTLYQITPIRAALGGFRDVQCASSVWYPTMKIQRMLSLLGNDVCAALLACCSKYPSLGDRHLRLCYLCSRLKSKKSTRDAKIVTRSTFICICNCVLCDHLCNASCAKCQVSMPRSWDQDLRCASCEMRLRLRSVVSTRRY